MCVYRIRPRDIEDDILSDEDFDDEELELTEADLARALETRIGGRDSKGKNQSEHLQLARRRMSRIRVVVCVLRDKFG